MISWANVTLAITMHDVRRDFQRPIALTAMALFAVGAMVAMHLAFAGSGSVDHSTLAGTLWLVLLLGALLGAGKSLGGERDDNTWDALLLAPVDRSALFVGKWLANYAFLIALHACILLAFAVFFASPTSAQQWLQLSVFVVAADCGFAAISTLVGGLTMFARGREVIAAAMFIPLTLPVVLAGVVATLHLLDATRGSYTTPLSFILIYDLLFTAIGIGVFPEIAAE